MTELEDYDAVVIGTGQAGKPLAQSLAASGMKTAIVERHDRVGGTCVLWGCTPTKTMVASARVAHLARRAADFGVRTEKVEVDLTAVRERKRNIVEQFSDGGRKGLEGQENLDLVFGEARFCAPHELVVSSSTSAERRLRAERIFINTGARPRVPEIDGLADVGFLDSTTIMELAEVPDHLVVVGGGYVGLEFGQMFRRFGARVTIVQRAGQLMPREDEDVATALTDILRAEGIEVLLSSTPRSVSRDDRGRVVVAIETPDGERELVASELLVATGRIPAVAALDLEAAGIETDEAGHVVVNDELETNVAGVYALGDVKGGPAFTHISYDDFRVVETNLLRGGGASTADRVVSYAVFTDPELGRVGLTEKEARERGMNVAIAKLGMDRVARALEMDETAGLMKAVIDAETDRIVGAAILGVAGGEVMTVLQVAMQGKLPYTAIRDGAFAHPTFSESLNNLFSGVDSRAVRRLDAFQRRPS